MATITSTEAGATGRYINLGKPSAHNDVGAQTIIVYAKPTGTGGGGFAYLFAKTVSGSISGPRFFITHNSGSPQLCFGAQSTGGGIPSVQGSANEVTYGSWAHFEVTWDGGLAASGMHVYVENVETTRTINSDGTGSITSDASNDIFLMNRGASGNLGREFVGDTGYIARWNRVLNSTERSNVRTNGPLSEPSGLILCWANNQDYSSLALSPTARSTFVAGGAAPNTALGGTITLANNAYPFSSGVASKGISIVVAGQSYALTQGSVGASTSSGATVGLTGQSYALTQGSVGAEFSKGMLNQAISFVSGSITASQISLSASYERASAILATSSIVGSGDGAVISIRPKIQESEAGNHAGGEWLEPSVDVSGVNGFRPTFRFLNYYDGDGGMLGADASWASTRRPMYSYDSGVTWSYFDTAVTRDTVNDWIEFRNSVAFTSNVVRISRSRQCTVHQVGAWLDTMASSYPSFFLPSASSIAFTPTGGVSGFAGQSFIADEFSAQTDSLGGTVPSTPLYAAEINDTSVMPSSGLAKRIAVITCGVHAGEDHSHYIFKSFVEYLCGGSAESIRIRREYRVIIYPMINAPGRAGGGWRGSWTQGTAGADDANRHFSDTGSTLEIVDKPKAAMTTDRSGLVPDWFIDFHGDWGNTWGIELDAGYSPGARFQTLLTSFFGTSISDVGDTLPGFLTTYFKNMGAKLVVIHESGDTTPITDSEITNHGIAIAKTLDAMMSEGDFFTVISGVAYSISQGQTTNSLSKGLAGVSSTISQGTLGVSTSATVALTGQTYALAQGTLGVSTSKALTGQTYTLSQGTLGVSVGNNVTVALTGQDLNYSQGSLTPGVALTAPGQTYSLTQGTLAVVVGNNATVALTGQSYALTQGLVGKAATVGLTGQYVSFTQGTLGVTTDTSYYVSLAGQNYALTQGKLGVTNDTNYIVPLTGQNYTYSQRAPSVLGAAIPLSGMRLYVVPHEDRRYTVSTY